MRELRQAHRGRAWPSHFLVAMIGIEAPVASVATWESPPSSGRKRRARGFTIVELLVVVAILAITALITTVWASRVFRRSKVQATAQDIQTLFQQVPIEATRRNQIIFVRLTPRDHNTSPITPGKIELIADTHNDTPATNAILDNPGTGNCGAAPTGDCIFRTYTLPEEVVFVACANATPCPTREDDVETANWSNDLTTGVRYLRIDFQGRTGTDVTVAAPAQITGVATLTLAHVQVLQGYLKPQIKYDLRINPVWSAALAKGVYDTGTNKYVYR